jgi:threonine/homoserine/homoserine lactone efflux protein
MFFVKGLVIGLMVAVPVGPLGLLCINRALSRGPAHGLFSGLGVATADAIAAGIAVLGLTLVSSFFLDQQFWLRLIGGFFLCYLGLKIFATSPSLQPATDRNGSLLGAYASTFFLTLSNPLTFLSFVAIYAGWGVEDLSGHYLFAAEVTAGVFSGSSLWWFILCGGTLEFHTWFTHQGLRWIHRISGAIITAFGLIVLLSLTQRLSG